jgi:radical SAM superfamily enzyme YgiQ (UPF0313 family)
VLRLGFRRKPAHSKSLLRLLHRRLTTCRNNTSKSEHIRPPIFSGIGDATVKKEYYLETRGDFLVRNKEVFRMWKRLGLKYMFLGIEAIDDEGLKSHRKRVTVKKNIEALECARSLNIHAAVNIIADPNWDERHFEAVREWALQVPEIVHITVNTPYPGTETWVTESRNFTSRDYRLFDVQHAVLPTKLPLDRF